MKKKILHPDERSEERWPGLAEKSETGTGKLASEQDFSSSRRRRPDSRSRPVSPPGTAITATSFSFRRRIKIKEEQSQWIRRQIVGGLVVWRNGDEKKLLKGSGSKVDAPPNEINLFYMRPRHRHSVET